MDECLYFEQIIIYPSLYILQERNTGKKKAKFCFVVFFFFLLNFNFHYPIRGNKIITSQDFHLTYNIGI